MEKADMIYNRFVLIFNKEFDVENDFEESIDGLDFLLKEYNTLALLN